MRAALLAAALVVLSGCFETEGIAIRPEFEAELRKASEPRNVAVPLWKVRWGETESYVLGTMHYGISAARIPVRIRWSMHAAESIYFESDDGVDFEKHPLFWLDDGSLPFRISRKAWLTLVDRSRLRSDHLRFFGPLTATFFLEMAELDIDGKMDAELLTEAKELGASVQFLDDPKKLPDILDELGRSAIANLDALLSDPARYEAHFRQHIAMIRALEAGGEGIEPVVAAMQASEKRLYDLLIVERNRLWLQTLLPALQKTPSFIAVGAAHLYGPDGLLDAFRAHGYEVTRD